MVLKGIWTFLLGLFFIYLQVLIMPTLSIWGITPLILLPWLIYMVWTREPGIALPVAFLIGLAYDTLNPSTFGLHALIFSILAILINIMRIPFEQDSIFAKLISIGSSNLVHSLLSLLSLGVAWGFEAKLYRLSFGAFLYNLIFSLVIFALMQGISRLRLTVVHE
ncbi:MAG TPA: rod shape-determining protein MreD [Candidatus Cloacimonadota bacterium]|nr:rod shape-determining protein MreD [Candidatus Cloacimonadota bacterium]